MLSEYEEMRILQFVDTFLGRNVEYVENIRWTKEHRIDDKEMVCYICGHSARDIEGLPIKECKRI